MQQLQRLLARPGKKREMWAHGPSVMLSLPALCLPVLCARAHVPPKLTVSNAALCTPCRDSGQDQRGGESIRDCLGTGHQGSLVSLKTRSFVAGYRGCLEPPNSAALLLLAAGLGLHGDPGLQPWFLVMLFENTTRVFVHLRGLRLGHAGVTMAGCLWS